MVTMKKIAELCNVSRGTVDRVLHGRGRVSEETAANIRRVAKELGYEPNPAAKALSARKHPPRVSVILPSEGNPFFDEVIRGLQEAADSYKIYGLAMHLHVVKGYDPAAELAVLEEVAQKTDAVLIAPIDDDAIRAAVDRLVDAGKFVVTVNGDLPGSKRQCYVGSDYENGGVTACALLEAFAGGQAKVGVVLGSRQSSGHRARLEGFEKRMEKAKGIEIAAVIENEDDEFTSFERTKEMLRMHPEITALFLVAGGVYGACRAVMELSEAHRPIVIAFDSVPSTVEMMKKGIVKAVLYQHPYRQGHRAMELAFERLVNGRAPYKEAYIMKHEIKLLENL
ncbi:MAG: LacI family DNA-binding transcriptional regulator [Selenomonas sp.]|uniref:LacI family DNA-binding transcriptional regulator n=1 Tax=Selenomonas sp. TaxID=2053611 RepID=UPI0025E3A26E|nr:LacI family DNA-binding transcriptional regulator [Selenomonas sp.]MCI6231031.1 LacI family DNA-binding transcriptional regulator [Selenomonas sp.]